MFVKDLFPFIAAPKPKLNPAAEDSKPNLSKKFKPRSLGLAFNTGYSYLTTDRRKALFEESPYDFDKILQAIDTDSYVKQAYLMYQDLFWKEGWTIVSENPEAVQYIHQRIDLFEEVMKVPFTEFLMSVVDNLVKFSNVFIAVVKGDLDPYYRVTNTDNKYVIGFYIIPTQSVKIHRDKYNRPIAYRQSLEDHNATFSGMIEEPEWSADEIIHLSLDKKEGHAFGTPFIYPALDDIISLRQVEQDILNLTHRELFPVYLYKVGTETHPSSPEELEEAQAQLENMRVEGGLIVPERHDVSVIGAESTALNVEEYLKHFKERVARGLGLYPHHLGMATDSTNRSATDRLDTALYDRIKRLQAYLEERVRTTIFNVILREGGFRPISTPSAKGVSDRCYMRFKEIDIDTQIKKENHIINKFAQNVIDLDEARLELEMGDDEIDMSKTLLVLTAMVQTDQQIEVTKAGAAFTPKPVKTATGATKLAQPSVKPDAKPSSTGVVPNLPNKKKATANKVAPSNQFGRRTSPNVRHANELPMNISESDLDNIVKLLTTNEDKESK